MARAVEVVMRRAGKTASSSFSRIVFARDPLMRTLKTHGKTVSNSKTSKTSAKQKAFHKRTKNNNEQNTKAIDSHVCFRKTKSLYST